MNSFAHSPDIFIVGGGPAGLAAAILSAQEGYRVAVADYARPPIDKACGEGLMPDTVAALNSLGITLCSGETVPFRGIRFHDANGGPSVDARFAQGDGAGIRRTVLHAKLVERAAALGVALLWGARVTLQRDGQVVCEGRPVRSQWVIGADGEASRVRKWAALERTRYEQIRFGQRQHFRIAPWSDFVDVFWARNCQIVVAPVASEELCVAITSRSPGLKFSEALSQVPELAGRLRGVSALDKVRGARAALRRLSRVYRQRFALIGDASGSVDPLTGEGIGLAFKQAGALVEAIQSGDLRSYQAAHDRIGRMPRLMSRLMLLIDRHSRLRRRSLRALAAEPSLFSYLLNAQIATESESKFSLHDAVRFGWRLVSAG
jgi:flavin-dependent dehydrogenase